jgi:hypothetical protein
MVLKLNTSNLVLVSMSVIFGAIALALACIGIGTPNWQITSANMTNGEMYTISTANFFYACRLNSDGEVLSCGQRSTNRNILQYYIINARGNESELNLHLNTAAGLSIIGIIFIFFGTITTLLMFCGDRAAWIFLIAPSYFFLACLFMLAGLAEGARVLEYNGYAANLYETAYLLTIFSFLINTIVAGRLFDPHFKPQQHKKIKRTK